MKVCLNESTGANATFSVIKGVNTFTRTSDASQMQALPGNNYLMKLVLTESDKCFEGVLYVDVDSNTDRYFFILEEYNYSIVDVDLQFNRTDYSPKYYTNTSKVNSCTINSHSIDECTAHLQKSMHGSSTALIVVTSDLDKPLFEWQETIILKPSYNLRADTFITVLLPVFVVNIIVFTILSLLWIKFILVLVAKSKSDSSTSVENKERVDTNLNEQTPLLQHDYSSRNTDGGPKHDINEGTTSFTVKDVPAVELSQSSVVPVDINPDATANTEFNDQSTSSKSDHIHSTSPVVALHNTSANANRIDAEQREEVSPIAAVQADQSDVDHNNIDGDHEQRDFQIDKEVTPIVSMQADGSEQDMPTTLIDN